MKRCVGVGVAVAVVAWPVGAGAGALGTQAPPGAQRALTAAFWRAHPGKKAKLKLIGFRSWQGDPVAAAYFLTRAPGGGYARGDQEYYKRVGSTGFKRTSRVPAIDADNLAPAYLFSITSSGSGTQTAAYRTTRPDDQIAGGVDVETQTTTEHFDWQLKFGPRGRAVELGDPGGVISPNGLTGAIAYTATSNDDPAQNYTCAGALRFTGQGPAITETENVRHRAWDFAIQIGGEDVSGGSKVVGAPPDPAAVTCPSADLDPERLVGAARISDRRFAPVSRSASHVASFAVRLSSANKALATAIHPHQASTTKDSDGTTTSTQDLTFSGTLRFTLAAVRLPHGLLGAAD